MRPNSPAARASGFAAGIAVLAFAAGAAHAEDVKTTVTRDVNTDGSSAVYVSSSPMWLEGASFGFDLSMAASTVATFQPTRTLPWDVTDTSNAAAWAKVSLPTDSLWMPWQQTTFEMRVDPSQNEGKFGTTFSRDMQLNRYMTASVNDSYAVIHTTDTAGGWEIGKSVSLKLLDTGTTFSIGATNSSTDRLWLPTATAEQKLFGPLNVTTSVADTGSEITKSITAGYKYSW
ncbi:hypothetical protein GCM10007301_14940 [Azorhizobium oxalatiphilum]|uniref:Uncharacterized protein n=1 Tax=Azorhizobium oxalatiphilum TaxID=980631 RepID=A0A917BRT4_9HYPH|nr:hypothetical protein [Azorhizobium oxalatiphilum]GGF56336.1 hypothetical protein GCM10007301_14940 [Azorhizobium oxalatiphilum]